jgi:hypothetical protein
MNDDEAANDEEEIHTELARHSERQIRRKRIEKLRDMRGQHEIGRKGTKRLDVEQLAHECPPGNDTAAKIERASEPQARLRLS